MVVGVVAGTTVKLVPRVGTAPDQRVVPRRRGRSAVDHVVSTATMQQVRLGIAVQIVVAAAAQQRIGTAMAEQVVVAITAVKVIGIIAADDRIVAPKP